MATSLGGFVHGSMLEGALAAALTLRGAQVGVLLCDSFLPACQLSKISSVAPDQLLQEKPQSRCASCSAQGETVFAPLGLPIYWYRSLVQPGQARQAWEISNELPVTAIRAYSEDGVAIGEHAYAGALRYYARGDLEGEPLAEAVLRRYLHAALLSTFAVQSLLDREPVDVACFHHGIYVPQGLVGEVCRRQGVRIVNWNPAYRRHTFIFSHDDSYHHTMITEPSSAWESIPWTPEVEAQTLAYMKSRWYGTEDWIWFHKDPTYDAVKEVRMLGIDSDRPIIGMLSSVMWDAQLHYKSNAFPNMLDWGVQTIRYFASRPDLQLVIRVHPAEIRGLIPSRQLLADEIRRAFPELPPNVFIIPPEHRLSTYALVERCNAVIIYSTKMGIEVASTGVPVIVAGEAWVRNKGFSLDAGSPEEYFRLLERLPLPDRLGPQQLERARKYAFHFFFRRMIPLPFIREAPGNQFALDITSPDDLRPGRYPGLDVVCDGILEGRPFIYPAERLSATARRNRAIVS